MSIMSQCEFRNDSDVKCNRRAIPGIRYCWQHMFKNRHTKEIAVWFVAVATIIGFFASLKGLGLFPFNNTELSIPRVTEVPIPTMRTGQSTGDSTSFFIYPNYDPSGYMGDIGDVTVEKSPDMVRFIYETTGRGPHEWEWKYVNDTLNRNPAKFAGVMYLNPPNNWGSDSIGGFDLRGVRRIIKWEARSITGRLNVEFVIGGIVWKWDDQKEKRVSVPYPESMIRTSLGMKTLNEDWQSFEADLSHLPEDSFRCVVGGFAWIIGWESNQVRLNTSRTGPDQPKKFVIEIRNIQYKQ